MDNHVSIRFKQEKLARQYYSLRKRLREVHKRPDLADGVKCYCIAKSPTEATHAYPAEDQGPNGETIVVLLRQCHPEVCRIIVASPERNAEMKKFYDEVVVPRMS